MSGACGERYLPAVRAYKRSLDVLPSKLAVSCCMALVLAACSAGVPASSVIRSASPATSRAAPSSTASVSAEPAEPPELAGDAYREVVVSGGPNVVTATQDAIWVELHRGSGVVRIEPETMATEPLPDVHVHCFVAAAPDAVWATEAASSTVTRIDAATAEVTTTATIPDACGLGVTADDVWVTSPRGAKIFRLDPATAEVLMEVETPPDPFTVFPRGDVVFAAGEGGGGWLARFDVTTGEPLDEWMAPDVPFFDKVEFTEDAAWAVGRSDPNLYRLDPVTGEPQGQIMIGREPSGVVVAGDAVWVSQLGGRLSRIDPSTGSITNTWTMPYSFLNLFTFAFDSLWLTSLEENAIIRIDIDRVDISAGR